MNQINQIISAMETGEITKKNGRAYSKATVKFYREVIASIKLDLKDPLVSVKKQLRARGAEVVTETNYLAVVRFFLRHMKIEFTDVKTSIQEPAVYIPEPERVWEMINTFEPENRREKTAFAFIVAEAITSARYLDISKWTYANIIQYKGSEYLRYTQSKTGKTIQLPLSPLLKLQFNSFTNHDSKLLPNEKYHTVLRNVKLVFKRAGFTRDIKRVRFSGKEIKVEIFQEWQIMGTHRLRAAAITGMLQSGMSESEVKRFSGHSGKSNSFSRYVEFSQQHIDNKYLNFINQ